MKENECIFDLGTLTGLPFYKHIFLVNAPSCPNCQGSTSSTSSTQQLAFTVLCNHSDQTRTASNQKHTNRSYLYVFINKADRQAHKRLWRTTWTPSHIVLEYIWYIDNPMDCTAHIYHSLFVAEYCRIPATDWQAVIFIHLSLHNKQFMTSYLTFILLIY